MSGKPKDKNLSQVTKLLPFSSFRINGKGKMSV